MKKTTVKGLHKLYWLTQEQIDRIEHSAWMHRHYANIGFKVVVLTDDEQIILRVYQGKAFSENYASRKRLVEIGHETFDFAIGDRKLYIGPAPYVPTSEDLAKIKAIEFGEWLLKEGWRSMEQETKVFWAKTIQYGMRFEIIDSTTEELYKQYEEERIKQGKDLGKETPERRDNG